MDEKLKLCAAAFFRNRGKDIVTVTEFLMDVSVNKRWMTHSEAEDLLSSLISERIVSVNGEYLKPGFDLAEVDIPLGYKPPKGISSKKDDIFRSLVDEATERGIDKTAFMGRCRTLQKSMNIDIEVAAVIALRDNGADVSDHIASVCDLVRRR